MQTRNNTVSMRERASSLIGLVEKGKFLEAIQEFYAEDAVMQENDGAPREGLANILANERRVMASFKEIHVIRADSFLVDGDRVAINWIFEFTSTDGRRHRMNEIAHQQWRDGKIVFEKFYYDPAQQRVEITPEGRPFESLAPVSA
jgi:ketosteroid isomerase-like protein